jgi:hypothetical protein
MLKSLFNLDSRYEKITRNHLQTAKLAALEHQLAAEHHAALAQMYKARAERLEQDLVMHEISPQMTERRISAVK